MLEIEKYKSGIKIKKSNRGKFTSYCGGEVTSACILKGKNSSNPTIRKRATFAANARKWKHQLGGILQNDATRVEKPFNIPPIKVVPKQTYIAPVSLDEMDRRQRVSQQEAYNNLLYKNQHMWAIDPTKLITKLNVGFEFNNAGNMGKPIRYGMAFAIGAGAVRSIPKVANAIKNEANIFGQSFKTTVPVTNYMKNGLPRTTLVNPWIQGTKEMLLFWKTSLNGAIDLTKKLYVGDKIGEGLNNLTEMYYNSQEPLLNYQYNGMLINEKVNLAILNGDLGIIDIFTDEN